MDYIRRLLLNHIPGTSCIVPQFTVTLHSERRLVLDQPPPVEILYSDQDTVYRVGEQYMVPLWYGDPIIRNSLWQYTVSASRFLFQVICQVIHTAKLYVP
jgi:hypothetical protein